MDTLPCCPACGQPDTLIPLGFRDDHPHRWRWWGTAITLLYLCERCDVLLEVDARAKLRRSWHKADTTRVMASASTAVRPPYDHPGHSSPPPWSGSSGGGGGSSGFD